MGRSGPGIEARGIRENVTYALTQLNYVRNYTPELSNFW
jgi:hypothetical protein